MKPYEKPSPQDCLAHYGVKGMKWGVRRYQNYDGSYTKKGLERYRKAESDYESAKTKAAETKSAYKSGQATRQQVKEANRAVKTEKRRMEDAYGKLKSDKLADEGKKLYQRGKTITGNTQTTYLAEAAIVVGSGVVSSLLSNTMKDQRVAYLAGSSIAIGGTLVNALLAGKASNENRGHTTPINAHYRRLLTGSADFLCLKSETHDKVVANSFMDRR